MPSSSVYCSSPPRVQHGAHNGPGEAEQFPLETVLKYTCYPGYLAVGFAHAKCFLYNTSAQWFGPDLTCKRKRLSLFKAQHLYFVTAITCGEPEEITAGILERKCQTFGCRISYTCEPGYQLSGRTHRYCQADGSWSPQLLPDCKRKLSRIYKNPGQVFIELPLLWWLIYCTIVKIITNSLLGPSYINSKLSNPTRFDWEIYNRLRSNRGDSEVYKMKHCSCLVSSPRTPQVWSCDVQLRHLQLPHIIWV